MWEWTAGRAERRTTPTKLIMMIPQLLCQTKYHNTREHHDEPNLYTDAV